MYNTLYPTDVDKTEFLLPTGVSRAVFSLKKAISEDTLTLLNSPSIRMSDILWLLDQLIDMRIWNPDFTLEDMKLMKEHKEAIITYNLIKYGDVLRYMSEVIITNGNSLYERLKSVDYKDNQQEGGNSENYHSSILSNYILFGIRFGIDNALIQKWQVALEPNDYEKLENNIFPIQKNNL